MSRWGQVCLPLHTQVHLATQWTELSTVRYLITPAALPSADHSMHVFDAKELH